MIERIKEVIEYKQMSASKFASVIGVAQTTLSGHLNDQRKINIDVICGIVNSFEDISAEWLLTGKGEMIRNKSGGIDTDNNEIIELREQVKELTIENRLMRDLLGARIQEAKNIKGKSA